MDGVKKAVFEEEEKTNNNKDNLERSTSDKKSSVSNDSGKGVISSFLETCRKIDDSHAQRRRLNIRKEKKRRQKQGR